jgi:hypothetical protein
VFNWLSVVGSSTTNTTWQLVERYTVRYNYIVCRPGTYVVLYVNNDKRVLYVGVTCMPYYYYYACPYYVNAIPTTTHNNAIAGKLLPHHQYTP